MAQLYRQFSTVLTLAPAAKKEGRRIVEADLGVAEKQSLIVEQGKIAWIGSDKKVPAMWAKKIKKETQHEGETLLPGFVECHTHTVFGGSRSAEFELRNRGVSYQQISKKGGGIKSTVNATSLMKDEELLRVSQQRVDDFVSQGVTTLEVKSGYGLSMKEELRSLRVANQLRGPKIVTTFLGAHSRDSQFLTAKAQLQNYLEHLKEIKKYTSRFDIFIEKNFFSKEDGSDYLQAAQKEGFQVTLHADQLSLSGGADLGVLLEALSVDHVLQIKAPQIKKIAQSQTVAVLLPAADFYMKMKYPPARKLIDSGAIVALATDFNPGTSPTTNINFVGALARLEMKMSLPEVISAYTVGGARALGLHNEVGSLEVGKSANLISINNSWEDLFLGLQQSSVNWSSLGGKLLQRSSKS